MERKSDRRRRYRKPYEPVRSQNFPRRENCEEYHDKPFGKFKHVNPYHYRKGRQREMTNHFGFYNPKGLIKREVQNMSSNINKKICPWSEEAAEEERKRQVSDTANELKNKLKMWNTVKSENSQMDEKKCSENINKAQRTDMNVTAIKRIKPKNVELIGVNNERVVQQFGQAHKNENSMDGENIHILNQEISIKKPTSSGTLLKSNALKCQSFSITSKSKQKKIHQSLIGELMAIPKDNLKEVLVNPQTHPKIEQKMAQIVKENRLILAQKFRSLAESKINQQGQFLWSKFVDDVGDLIDSDLAVDLCQLPPELITQISDIFQLDFKDSLKASDVQENSQNDKNINESCNPEMALNCGENLDENDQDTDDRISQYNLKEASDIKVESQILNDAECDDLLKDKIVHNWYKLPSPENFQNTLNLECVESSSHLSSFPSCMVSSEAAVTATDCCDIPGGSDIFNRSKYIAKTFSNHINNSNTACKVPSIVDDSTFFVNETSHEAKESEEPNYMRENTDKFAETNMVGNNLAELCGSKGEEMILNFKRDIIQQKAFAATEKNVPYKCDNNTQSIKKVSSESENPVFNSTETQTDINLIEADHSQPFLGHFYSEGTEKSLLREVQMIDDLLHKLNQRRFLIFLKLVGLESCNLNKNNLKTSLMQTITNSDAKLMEELSLGVNQNGENKRNYKRNINYECQKNISKKVYGKKNAEDGMINELGVNFQDSPHSRRKIGSKTKYWKEAKEYV